MRENKKKYHWKFKRVGGLDQVVLSCADDIAHLDELDPKLWVALSCPASGFDFDNKTLSLLDDDKDDRIRIPDVIGAIKWLKARLNRLDSIINGSKELPLSAINTKIDEGKKLLITAQAILANINQPDKKTISLDDLKQSTLFNSNNLYNGDGIIPPTPKLSDPLLQFIKDALNVMGGVKDASGLDGINNQIVQAFRESLQNWLIWHNSVSSATTPLGEDTAEAWQLVQDVKDKVNDYFLRAELASYAPQAQNSLNVDEKYIVPTDNGLLSNVSLAELPLSRVVADQPLMLDKGLNPIWRDKITRLAELIQPFLADKHQLTREDWLNIQKLLTPYSMAVESKPALVSVNVTIQPKITIDKLGSKRINEILGSDLFEQFEQLSEKDSKTPAAAADVADIEKLISFHNNLYRLLMNFVTFEDFFDLDTRRAAFQSGRLFIDGRCCLLCIPVNDISKHTTLANYSELFLLYCECSRKNPPVNGNQEKKTIVAAMTAGDSDFLLEGRNGVFIDNDGHDWDAKVVKIISKPISISQAIWDPYKRLGRFITDQINKWANSKDSAVLDTANKAVQAPDQKFDISKSMGIFAAIGLALGALGTALASIASSLFQLKWWQFPLVFLGIFLIISGPSVILAWIKLHQRTLGPLLEASGWAINGKVKINFFLGGQLTSKAELPPNSSRCYIDPMLKTKRKTKYWLAFFLALLISIVITGVWLWKSNYLSHLISPSLITTLTKPNQIDVTQPIPPSSTQ